jgi:ribonuclease M5
MKIKELIVVEGRDDVNAVKRAVDAELIVTNGFGIRAETFQRIEVAQRKKGVIILTDPDHMGERIRDRINARIKGCKNAYLTRTEARRKDNIGVENATPEAIIAALEKAHCRKENSAAGFTMTDLSRHNLSASPRAAQRREQLGRRLHIGYANAKQFLKRLNRYGISREEFDQALLTMDHPDT